MSLPAARLRDRTSNSAGGYTVTLLADLEALYQETVNAYTSAVHERWRAAAARDFTHFTRWLHTLPLGPDNAVFEIYESLAQSDDVPVSFFVGETRRLLRFAESHPREVGVYMPLGALAFLDADRSGYDDLVGEVTLHMHSSVPQIRRAAATLLGTLAYARHRAATAALRHAVEHDSDWRVRCMAHAALVDLRMDEPAMPPPPRLALLDGLRKWWRPPVGDLQVAA